MTTCYTTWGPVRGDCGHAHRSLAAAERCLRRDSAGCGAAGGYSDRGIRVLDGRRALASYDVVRGPGRPLARERTPA